MPPTWPGRCYTPTAERWSMVRRVSVLVVAASCVAAMFALGCDRISRAVTTRPDGKELEAYSQARGDRARLAAAQLPRAVGATPDSVGRIEPVALFYGPMPTGVTVSRQGRIFVNFPR